MEKCSNLKPANMKSRKHPVTAKDADIRLAIIVACYNEEDVITAFYQETVKVVEKYDYQFIFIDDGSKDATLEKLKKICREDANAAFISLSRNFGQQNALKAGYDHATHADCAICMDADLQHPPRTIDQLVNKWKEGYEIVNTIRNRDRHYPLVKRLSGKLFYSIINFISDSKILINGPDYRLLDRKVVLSLSKFRESDPYLKEIIPWIGYNQATVGFTVCKRAGGESKYSLLKLLSLSLRGITSFSINPLRLSSIIGLFFSMLAFLYCTYAVYVHVFTDNTVPGWTSIIASALLISGVQMVMLGIIGEYLGKTFIAAKERPQYIIRDAVFPDKSSNIKWQSGMVLDEQAE